MKKFILLTMCLSLAACGGTIFSKEHRLQSVSNNFLNVRKCESDKYYLIAENKDSNQTGWKSVRTFTCIDKVRLSRDGSLDGKIYTREEMKALAKRDPYVSNLFHP